MNNVKIVINIISGLLLISHGLIAQDLPGGRVEVVKNFEARLADAQKIKLEPEAEVKEVVNSNYQYEIQEQILGVEYPAPTIKAIGIKTEPLPTAYNGFVKAGYGYPLSPYLDAGYRFGDSEATHFLARLTHHSANDNNLENQRFVDNDIHAAGTVVTNYGFAVDGKANVSFDEHYFYGYDHEFESFDRQDVQNKLNLYEFGVKLYNNTETVGKLNYWAGIDVYLFNNNFSTRETGLDLDLGLTKWFGDNPLSISLGTDLTRLRDTEIRKLNNFFVNPTFSFGTRNVRAQLGARLVTSNEEYFIFPDVELLLNLAGNNLSVFAGADGDLRKNNFRILSDYNPYMVAELSDIRNANFFDFYGGIKGIMSGLEYSFQAGYKPTDDLALFKGNDDEKWTRFDVVYDTADIVYFKGALKGTLFENLQLSGSLVYNIYDTKIEDKAWYLPELQANIGVSYLALDDRLRLKAETYLSDPVPFEDLELPNEPNLLLDVSLGADFFFTQHIGAFLHLNNLAANKYRRWYGYPNYGLNVLGGVTARF